MNKRVYRLTQDFPTTLVCLSITITGLQLDLMAVYECYFAKNSLAIYLDTLKRVTTWLSLEIIRTFSKTIDHFSGISCTINTQKVLCLEQRICVIPYICLAQDKLICYAVYFGLNFYIRTVYLCYCNDSNFTDQ